MKDDLIQIIVTVGILLLGILQPLISKFVKRAGMNLPEIIPEIPDEEFPGEGEGESEGEENSEPDGDLPRLSTDAHEVPEQAKEEPATLQAAKESASKRVPLDKRKMIIYSEIMKPKFDEF